ncbi:nucleoid-associated protein [Chryseobacterium sp. B21-037]|uniref:nucleoid-associated protein n=1 Tax=Chryseobacterium sp. B21-037 TaxID=2926038 RepID=UPI00235835EC|nr:nucleoid-associated protein [Chryseobacterium sp. B21-037]MDC8103436.1 nucleoid-associated protein [Chryseobacterium sp. B21-037]
MTKLKEKGHNVNLKNIVIHKINKAAGDKKSTLKLALKEIKVGDPERKFIYDVRESISKRSVPTHGVFEDVSSHNGFQQAIINYKDNKIDFMQFSVESMEYYKRTIETSAPATGGFLIFADFKITDNNDERYILVLSIDNKEGYNLSEIALAIQEIQNLELNKMDLAAIINLSRWELSKNPGNEIKTYLTFIRGKKKISDYFQNFIGCEDKTTATESSTILLNTINSYIKEKEINDKIAKDLKGKILDYCQDCNKQKKEILLSHISFLFDEENPDDFATYASHENFGNSEVIKYDSKTLRTLKYIDYQSVDFTLKFNKRLLNTSIKLSKDKRTITISNLPEELISQF